MAKVGRPTSYKDEYAEQKARDNIQGGES